MPGITECKHRGYPACASGAMRGRSSAVPLRRRVGLAGTVTNGRDAQLEGAVLLGLAILEVMKNLDQSVARSAFANEERAIVEPERPGDNPRAAGRCRVNQHHQLAWLRREFVIARGGSIRCGS